MLSGAHGSEGGSTILRLWDIEAKRCILSFIGHSRYADTVSFSAGCAGSQAWGKRNLRIWDLSNGTCRHSIEVDLSCGTHAASNEEVFVPNLREEDGAIIDVINVHTGVIRSSLCQAWCLGDRAVELHICAAVPHDADDYDDESWLLHT
jgi:WD40 repeat protein